MINLLCQQCAMAYSKQRPPKVLPCGHSMCSNCIFNSFESKGVYQCRTCVQSFDSMISYPPPTNLLFFEMIQRVQQLIRQKQWEQGGLKQNQQSFQPSQVQLRIQQQCLYTFCQRRKFERDGIFELYCSQECKKNYEELEQIT